jgi:hypothetical protein
LEKKPVFVEFSQRMPIFAGKIHNVMIGAYCDLPFSAGFGEQCDLSPNETGDAELRTSVHRFNSFRFRRSVLSRRSQNATWE